MKTQYVSFVIISTCLLSNLGCIKNNVPDPNAKTREKLVRQVANSYGKHDYASAIEAQKKLVSMYPSEVGLQYELGMALNDAKRKSEATAVFKKVVASKEAPYAALSQTMINSIANKP